MVGIGNMGFQKTIRATAYNYMLMGVMEPGEMNTIVIRT